MNAKKKFKYLAISAFTLASFLALVSCNNNKEEATVIKGTTYYVNYNGTGDGLSKENPIAFDKISVKAEAGDTLLLEGGTYSYGYKIGLYNSGKNGGFITVKPQENTGRVIFDFSKQTFNSNNRGIQIYGDFWYFDTIEICNAGDNGMYIAGDYNVIDNCLFYNNADTGLQLGRTASEDASIETWPSYNLIKNCTSFANFDEPTYGENADGFAAKLTVGYGNVFDGCIAFRNSDDGWDMYAKQDSGCIGTVALYNCVSFENGYLPYQIDRLDAEGNTYKSYDTLNGDGIGFKLGGSTMEGDVIVENSLAFNNKLHGFGDNSNPGFLYLRNSTAFNNCMGLNEDGTVGSVRGIKSTTNKSNNFDLARDTNSYNSYYGLLSYINNQDDFMSDDNGDTADNSYNADKFRGSVGYSIFQTSYDDGEIYTLFEDYKDSSVYRSGVVDTSFYAGKVEKEYVSDDDFKSLAPINAMCESVDHLGDLLTLHKQLRNEDNSVNMGDRVQLKETSKLYSFKDGKPVGAVLNKTSYDEYEHYNIADLNGLTNPDKISIQSAYNTLEVLTNEDAVYQDFQLCKFLHECTITWKSENEDVIIIDTEEDISVSLSVFSYARVKTPKEVTKVKLIATITKGAYSKDKVFELTVRPRIQALGSLTSSSLVDTFKVTMYGGFVSPNIYALDKSSNTTSILNPELYTMTTKYMYASDGNSDFYEVDNVYTSVPGVYSVTVTAVMNDDSTQKASYTYNVYILDSECEIDIKSDSVPVIVLNSTGYVVNSELSNVYGDIYSVWSTTPLTLTAAQLVAREDVQVVEIFNDSISAQFESDNTIGKYYGYYTILNKEKTNIGTTKVYSFVVDTVDVTTLDEFHDLATKGKFGSVDAKTTTIFNLKNDLDFANYDWKVVGAGDVKPFSSLFNGNDHTISNLTVIGESNSKNVNVFYKVSDGTIMNVNFNNIVIWNKDTTKGQVGIVGELQGGYLFDIHMINISARGREGVSALVGIVSGRDNYIDSCSLVNPIVYNNDDYAQENNITNLYAVRTAEDFGFVDTNVKINDDTYLTYSITAYNKYAGGIVGNVQKNNDQSSVSLTVTNCYVNAIIGDGKDAGGCMGGIIGRVKNESLNYNVVAKYNYYNGIILSKGNYNGGIIGSIESAMGNITANNNLSQVVFQLDGELFNAYEFAKDFSDVKVAHKNCSPIIGRASSSTEFGSYVTADNYGTWNENYSTVVNSTSILFSLSGEDDNGDFKLFSITKEFYTNLVKLDLENVWTFNETTKDITLKNRIHA